MKQYKLIKWYPSLQKDWEVGMIVGLEDSIPTSFSPCNRKYKDYYVFSEPRLYVICYKKSDKFKELMGI